MLHNSGSPQTDRIVEAVRTVLTLGPKGSDQLPLDEDLHERGLTSLNMVNVMLAIESEFGFEIPQRELHPDNFRTMRAIDDLVSRLRNG